MVQAALAVPEKSKIKLKAVLAAPRPESVHLTKCLFIMYILSPSYLFFPLNNANYSTKIVKLKFARIKPEIRHFTLMPNGFFSVKVGIKRSNRQRIIHNHLNLSFAYLVAKTDCLVSVRFC